MGNRLSYCALRVIISPTTNIMPSSQRRSRSSHRTLRQGIERLTQPSQPRTASPIRIIAPHISISVDVTEANSNSSNTSGSTPGHAIARIHSSLPKTSPSTSRLVSPNVAQSANVKSSCTCVLHSCIHRNSRRRCSS